jgi:hypothetical protein
MSKLLVLFAFITSSFAANAQEDFPPIPPPPEVSSSIYLVGTDPNPPQPQRPSDPADAGDLLIFVDTRGETLTITDGRGVGLILVLGDGQGTVVGPIQVDGRPIFMDGRGVSLTPATSENLGVRLTCEQALGLIVNANLMDAESVNSAFDSGLTECQTLKSILIDINPNVIRPLIKTESGTLI